MGLLDYLGDFLDGGGTEPAQQAPTPKKKTNKDTDGLSERYRPMGARAAVAGTSTGPWDRLQDYAELLAKGGDDSMARALAKIEGRRALGHAFPTLADRANDAGEFEAAMSGAGQAGRGLAAAERAMGHRNSARGGRQGSGMSGGYGSGLAAKQLGRFEDDLNFKRDLGRERDRMNLEAYFNNKELGDRMNMIQNFFGRNPRGFNRRETSTTQQIVNNAGSWEPRPITSTTETDMTMDILSQLLRG